MKKFLSIILVFSLGMFAFAQSKVSLEVGAHYANNQLHDFGSQPQNNIHNHDISYQHMGGFNLAVIYNITNEWSVYADSAFSFNNVFANDTVLGFGYNFDINKTGIRVFVGGGLALGGLVMKNKQALYTTQTNYFNMGLGIQSTLSYMFTKTFGIYTGINAQYYGVVSEKVKTESSAGTSTVTVEKKYRPDMASSFLVKVGLKVNF